MQKWHLRHVERAMLLLGGSPRIRFDMHRFYICGPRPTSRRSRHRFPPPSFVPPKSRLAAAVLQSQPLPVNVNGSAPTTMLWQPSYRLQCLRSYSSVRVPSSTCRSQPLLLHRRYQSSSASIPYRSPTILDNYVETPARPISLRQLIFFGSRNLDSKRILNSANYVRTELPTRISHRIRDMQRLPYVVVTNRHISYVYNLYYEAFESLRKVPEIKTVEDNEKFCEIIRTALKDHLTVIPRLAMGVLECRDLLPPEQLNRFMNTLLRSRISRRVIAEQHLALTDTLNSPFHSPNQHNPTDFVGEVFLRCNAREVVSRVGHFTQALIPPDLAVPEIKLEGHLDTSFPYILSHLEYIIGELLRNSIDATLARHPGTSNPPPITILICNAPKHIIFRISDQGGGIPPPEVSDLWSFAKHTRSDTRLRNFAQVPKMSATLQELHLAPSPNDESAPEGSLHSLTYRRPDLKLGMGLPMSRVYAEYWGGSLEQTSMEGYGTDVFLHIEKLGNRLEQLNIDSL